MLTPSSPGILLLPLHNSQVLSSCLLRHCQELTLSQQLGLEMEPAWGRTACPSPMARGAVTAPAGRTHQGHAAQRWAVRLRFAFNFCWLCVSGKSFNLSESSLLIFKLGVSVVLCRVAVRTNDIMHLMHCRKGAICRWYSSFGAPLCAGDYYLARSPPQEVPAGSPIQGGLSGCGLGLTKQEKVGWWDRESRMRELSQVAET
jgi:hypothetical protein